MNILYLGNDFGTSRHRADALTRLGHHVRIIDPEPFVPKGRWAAKIHFETGGLLCEKTVTTQTLAQIGAERYELVLVNGGRYVGPSLVKELQRRFGPVINYNNDDPLGSRDRFSWSLYRRTVSSYDLMVVLRDENIHEAAALGAKKTLRVFFSADEVAHAPREVTREDHLQWDSEVIFVGTWMPERGPFIAELIELGVPLSIYGGRWQRAPEWPIIQSVWKGPPTDSDDQYAKAIQCAKIGLGLVSKGNRDLHTTRSLEIPALGTVLCALRTPEHQQLYCEGEEAVFWVNSAECAEACFKLLGNDRLRREIALNGKKRTVQNGTMNEQIMARVLAQVGAEKSL